MSALSTFRALRKFLTPAWLREGADGEGEGELVGYSLDLIKDAFLTRTFLGLMIGYPQWGPNGETAPADALQLMGQDRRVVRGISETDTAYALRLRQYLTDRKTCGNPFTLMKVLASYLGAGSSFRTVDAHGNWYSRDASGVETSTLKTENWNWDGDASGRRWSRFWVIVYPPTGLWTTNTWGEAGLSWGEADLTWGSTATQEQVATLKHLVNDWKPRNARCVNIIVAFDPASFDPSAPEPDGLWERWSKVVDGVRVPSRLSTARYIDGSDGVVRV